MTNEPITHSIVSIRKLGDDITFEIDGTTDECLDMACMLFGELIHRLPVPDKAKKDVLLQVGPRIEIMYNHIDKLKNPHLIHPGKK